ncbi:Ig-like domain-containing protein [Muriicola sp. Z0-33]|uniref:Ig-like domain-containing protein n=1 Tax=Muriicola sp. Z0-33 TaxID=2816957 RepID=UPI00223896F3|nr:Ig-like domain-containing protein [Muriicola sp. Z0-33]MCW5514928.1 Ig-like domain-containing protein [Muriicola sp. Z0-33]
MGFLKRIVSGLFIFFLVFALMQCAKRGNPTGGPKDVTAPVLIKSEPENFSINFNAQRIRLYFDEYIKLEDVQNQLIISPPLKYNPQISPQGGASKYVEIIIKDTLEENTTYTLNFGQSIVDNNEGNPNSFLNYVFSTGDYLDSLTVSGVVKDAFNKDADEFISVMLYAIDTAYTDSTVYKSPPNYITNTQDSTVIFELKNLKEGRYAMVGVKDESKNNLFDQLTDKIGFVEDTITLPTDSIFLLTLFREIPDYSVLPPNYAASNKIIFGYNGKDESLKISPLTVLPDSIRTLVRKEVEKDSLNFWFTPFEVDSLIFIVENEKRAQIDTFVVKPRKLAADSLILDPSHRGNMNLEEEFSIEANIPLVALDSTRISMINKDSIAVDIEVTLDTLKNKINFSFDKEPNENYNLVLLPDAVKDFFEATNDTLNYRLSTGSYADYGNLSVNVTGPVSFPMIVQLVTERGEVKREIYSTEPQLYEFNTIEPANYLIRVIFDTNKNGQWDTGNYLKKIQPEKVSYYPRAIEIRANWEKIETFTVLPN